MVPVAGLLAVDLLTEVAHDSFALIARRIFSFRQDGCLVCFNVRLFGSGRSVCCRIRAFLLL